MSVDADDPSVMTGTYVVPSDVSSEFLEVTGVTSGTVEDSFGNTMTSTDVPTSASSLADSAISVDYEAPTSRVLVFGILLVKTSARVWLEWVIL